MGQAAKQEGDTSANAIRDFFARRVPWRMRVAILAFIVGLSCGIVCSIYTTGMHMVLDKVWKEGGAAFAAALPGIPSWSFILLVCTVMGASVGVLLRVLGEPLANLPGVVMAAHRDGLLGHEEAPAMAAISIAGITGAGSLGPEAPLVSIGGGLASFVCIYVDLSEAETLFVTMTGMGAGLSAFFGEPIGGALFACEVLHRYGLEYYEAVLPTVIAGLACNWSFRVASGLPQKPIWEFAAEEPLLPWTSILGLLYGTIGGLLGRAWMRGTNLIRERVLGRFNLGSRHIVKGLVGGFLIGCLGVIHPETLFWAEHEAQTIIDHGVTPLPHVWPHTGVLGDYSLRSPLVLTSIGMCKLLAISITVLAGYRGGFIFPFMFAGHAIGTGLAIAANVMGLHLSPAAAALSCACAINVAVTRTWMATPIVLSTLSGRTDVCPTMLVASLISLYVTGDEAIITAARKRWLRAELDGCEVLEDPTPTVERRRTRLRAPGTTPPHSVHGGDVFCCVKSGLEVESAHPPSLGNSVHGGAVFNGVKPSTLCDAVYDEAPDPKTPPKAAGDIYRNGICGSGGGKGPPRPGGLLVQISGEDLEVVDEGCCASTPYVAF